MTRTVLADLKAHSFHRKAGTVVTLGDFDSLVAATKLTPGTSRWADYPSDEDDGYLDGLSWSRAPRKPTDRLSYLTAFENNKMTSSACMVCSGATLEATPSFLTSPLAFVSVCMKQCCGCKEADPWT